MATIVKRGKSWFVQVRRKGVSKSASFPTKGQASAWATHIESEILSGLHHVGSLKTFEHAVDRYLEEVTPKKKSAQNEKYLIAQIKRAPFASKRINDLTTEDVAQFRDDLLKRLKSGSVVRYIGLISAVCEIARTEWQWIAKNPVKDVKKPSSGPSRDRLFSEQEIALILETLGHNDACTDVQQCVSDAFLFAIETAMRAGEIRLLTWANIDLEQRVAHLPKTKNGDKRNVPLSSKAISILQARQNQPLPFDIKAHTLCMTFKIKCRQCGINDATFHDTRHTAITRLAKKLQPFDLARMVGHKNMTMTLRYYNETAADIAKKLD